MHVLHSVISEPVADSALCDIVTQRRHHQSGRLLRSAEPSLRIQLPVMGLKPLVARFRSGSVPGQRASSVADVRKSPVEGGRETGRLGRALMVGQAMPDGRERVRVRVGRKLKAVNGITGEIVIRRSPAPVALEVRQRLVGGRLSRAGQGGPGKIVLGPLAGYVQVVAWGTGIGCSAIPGSVMG